MAESPTAACGGCALIIINIILFVSRKSNHSCNLVTYSCVFCYTDFMIQIFGTNKSFDCKAAQRFFKERRIPFQFVDLKEKEMSAGEFDSVVSALARTEGGRDAALDALIDKKSKDYASIAYLDDSEKEGKLFENQAALMKQPVCRNGKTEATVGMAQKIWEGWK